MLGSEFGEFDPLRHIKTDPTRTPNAPWGSGTDPLRRQPSIPRTDPLRRSPVRNAAGPGGYTRTPKAEDRGPGTSTHGVNQNLITGETTMIPLGNQRRTTPTQRQPVSRTPVQRTNNPLQNNAPTGGYQIVPRWSKRTAIPFPARIKAWVDEGNQIKNHPQLSMHSNDAVSYTHLTLPTTPYV